MRACFCIVLPVLLWLGSAAVAAAQNEEPQRYHTEWVASFNPDPDAPEGYSGVTGYVAPDGREYAILGGFTDIHVIDVSELPVRLVATISSPWSGQREITTAGQYAYAVNGNGRGLQIIDLSRLPASAEEVRSDSTVFSTAASLVRDGNYLYVGGSDIGAGAIGGALIFDLSKNPVQPELAGTFAGHRVDVMAVRNDTMYAIDAEDGLLSIVDLGADRKNPRVVADVAHEHLRTQGMAVAPDGTFMITVRDINNSGGIYLWDLRNPGAIKEVSSFSSAFGPVSAYRVRMRGSSAIVAGSGAGTVILDVRDPVVPAEVGVFNSYSFRTMNSTGNLDVYPYLPSGKILASYSENGLEIFTHDGAGGGTVHGVVRDAATLEPIANASIQIGGDMEGGMTTDDEGRYVVSIAGGDVEFAASKRDYVPTEGMFSIRPANITHQDILLQPVPMAVRTIAVLDEATGAPVDSFSYRTVGRDRRGGTVYDNPAGLKLLQDSSYRVHVGSWGYVPAVVDVGPGTGSYEIRLKKGYADNAEVEMGWSYSSPDDDRFSSPWRRRSASGGGLAIDGVNVTPSYDYSPDPGEFMFELLFSQRGTLTSPSMDLSGYSDPYINCALWYSNDKGEETDDELELRVSDDDGGSWHTLARLSESHLEWREYHYRLNDLIIPGTQVRFQIIASDLMRNSIVIAELDEFSVTDGMPSSSAAMQLDAARGASAMTAPNPMREAGYLRLSLASVQQKVRGELFDLLGRRVALLYEGGLDAGEHLLPVDVAALAPGRYTWRIRLDDGGVLSGATVVMR